MAYVLMVTSIGRAQIKLPPTLSEVHPLGWPYTRLQ